MPQASWCLCRERLHNLLGEGAMLTKHCLCWVFTAFVLWQVLRHDIGEKKKVGTVSEAYPHLVLNNFSTKLGERVMNILKYLFPTAKDDSKRVMTFANKNDFISFRHHVYEQPKGVKSITLTECGPRFELKLYQIKLGTIDQPHAENEWVVRAYTRSAKKSKLAEASVEDV